MGIHLDISHRKSIESQLRDSKKKTEELYRVKELFLANMSHEIRTPMNAIIGMAELLEQSKLDSKQVSYVSAIRSSSKSLLVLINGSNFIDGNNTLSLGYFGLIFFTILNLENIIFANINENIIYSILVTVIVLYCFNITNKLYLGDNGIYLLASITGYILIDFFKSNPSISPYFIVNLLWYPAFEIFFSLLRKLKSKYSPIMPDTFHLHQLIYSKISNRFSSNLIFSNSLTGNLINIYNGFIFFVSSTSIYNTKMQLLILLINITIYTLLYLLFFKNWKTLNFKK